MQWSWCYLINNTPIFLRVVVISQFGQGMYYLFPGQGQWVQWYPGQKVMTLFDGNSGQLLYSYTYFVSGPGAYTVVGGGTGTGGQIPYSVQHGAAPSNGPGGAGGNFGGGGGNIGGGVGGGVGATT
jgi:hypothetical protein